MGDTKPRTLNAAKTQTDETRLAHGEEAANACGRAIGMRVVTGKRAHDDRRQYTIYEYSNMAFTFRFDVIWQEVKFVVPLPKM